MNEKYREEKYVGRENSNLRRGSNSRVSDRGDYGRGGDNDATRHRMGGRGGNQRVATTRGVWKVVPFHMITWLTGLVTSLNFQGACRRVLWPLYRCRCILHL